MRKMILRWLFGTDDIQSYIDSLCDNVVVRKAYIREIEKHIETLNREGEDLELIRKLIVVCKNHDIDVDAELQKIELQE